MCIILYTKIKDKFVLVKNRDKQYKPSIQIIHTLINGIEVAYLHDKYSTWIEGMNEYGTAITNATLHVHDDKHTYMKHRHLKKSRIFDALGEKNTQMILHTLTHKNDKAYTLEGHTLAYINGSCYHIKNNLADEYRVTKAKLNDVYTNHGGNDGFTDGDDGLSSYLRQQIVKKEMHLFNSYDDVAYTMNKNYINLDPRFHTYRNGGKNKYSTTGQLIMNVSDKELIYYSDKRNSHSVSYINALPKNYNPRIRVILKDVKKRMTPRYKIFTKAFLRKTYKKYT